MSRLLATILWGITLAIPFHSFPARGDAEKPLRTLVDLELTDQGIAHDGKGRVVTYGTKDPVLRAWNERGLHESLCRMETAWDVNGRMGLFGGRLLLTSLREDRTVLRIYDASSCPLLSKNRQKRRHVSSKSVKTNGHLLPLQDEVPTSTELSKNDGL